MVLPPRPFFCKLKRGLSVPRVVKTLMPFKTFVKVHWMRYALKHVKWSNWIFHLKVAESFHIIVSLCLARDYLVSAMSPMHRVYTNSSLVADRGLSVNSPISEKEEILFIHSSKCFLVCTNSVVNWTRHSLVLITWSPVLGTRVIGWLRVM